jgi:hypothetical protein
MVMNVDAFVSAGMKDSCYILSIFCRYTNQDYVKLRMVTKIRLVNIRRDVLCMPPKLTTYDQNYLAIVFLVRTNRMCIVTVQVRVS